MANMEDLLEGFELHSPEKIRAAIAAGADAKAPIHGKRPIEWLMEMYLRSGRFVECVRVMLEVGATLDDPMLEARLAPRLEYARSIRSTVGPEKGGCP
jgi:hypothetical protein